VAAPVLGALFSKNIDRRAMNLHDFFSDYVGSLEWYPLDLIRRRKGVFETHALQVGL
jgi:hypothetical protein